MWSVLVLCCVCLVSAEVEVEGEVVLELEHSLDTGRTWSARGKVTVTSSRSGGSGGGNDQLPLTGEQKERLRSLCAEDGLYLVRAQVWQGGAALGLMRSFTSSCSLVTSGMVDTLTLNTDHKGKVLGFTLSAAAPAQSPGLRDTFKTKIVTNSMEPGPAPDTAAFIQVSPHDIIAQTSL